ncbi:MAG: hypothetical protein QOI31_2373 [Solirubrobacterales bacterium]|nr:hypothetical protein [Solirubrobacterales bacterium]
MRIQNGWNRVGPERVGWPDARHRDDASQALSLTVMERTRRNSDLPGLVDKQDVSVIQLGEAILWQLTVPSLDAAQAIDLL